MRKNIALIFAGGTGKRMKNENTPKQFICIDNKPIIIHTLEHFQKNSNIDEIYVVCLKSWIEFCKEIIDEYSILKVKDVIPGGQTGQESIYKGLLRISEDNDKDSIVLIHDGVRPLIDQKIIDDGIKTVKKYGNAIPCISCTETIIYKEDEKVKNVPLRKNSFVAQAPQVFILDDILKAHNKIRKINPNYEQVIDSCTLYNLLGKEVYTFKGLDENIKITTPKDLYLLRAILDYQKNKEALSDE